MTDLVTDAEKALRDVLETATFEDARQSAVAALDVLVADRAELERDLEHERTEAQQAQAQVEELEGRVDLDEYDLVSFFRDRHDRHHRLDRVSFAFCHRPECDEAVLFLASHGIRP